MYVLQGGESKNHLVLTAETKEKLVKIKNQVKKIALMRHHYHGQNDNVAVKIEF